MSTKPRFACASDSAVCAFFDRHSACWDSREPQWTARVIEAILARLAPGPSDDVLDVACGTGILVPFLRARGVRSYAGVDFSPGMGLRFSQKHPGERLVVGDFQRAGLFAPASFSKIIIYNAFPHFSRPELAFANAFAQLRPGGELCIAHSVNRQALERHHVCAGAEVRAHRLASDAELQRLYRDAGFHGALVQDGDYFYSCGKKP